MKKTGYLGCVVALALAMWPLSRTVAASRCYPNSRYTVLSGGMVQDTLTGLVWQQDGSGTRAGCSGSVNPTCTWAEAKAYCAGLTLGGLSGWHLPTYKELSSIVDFTVTSPGPAINQTAFPNTPATTFWTSSPYAGSFGSAWLVYFDLGTSFNSVVGGYGWVRCVR